MSNVITQRFVKCHNQLKEEDRVRSSRQFAKALDYLPQSLSEIMRGRRDVTIELLRKAVEVYHMNPVYLLTGEGPLFMSAESAGKGLQVLAIVANGDNEERIVHVPVPAQAGYASSFGDPRFVQELPSYTLPDYKYRVGTHRSFDVSGDSMEPTLFEGDKVVCSFVEPALWETGIKEGYVYVLVTRADVLVKRVDKRLPDERALLLASDNNFYEPYVLPLSELREVWYVRARISPFLPSPENIGKLLRSEIGELRQIIKQQSALIDSLQRTLEKVLEKG